MKLLVVGGGKMGEALVSGLIATSWCTASDITIVEPLAARRDELVSLIPGAHIAAGVPDPQSGAAGETSFVVDTVVIAVKPYDVPLACQQVRHLNAQRIISIAAGVRIETLQKNLEENDRVIRAMPNTPALIGQGASAMAGSANCRAEDILIAQEILGAVGTVVTVNEIQLDAVTGLSGSGPAYVFLVAEALIDAGVAVGLTREVATILAHQTVAGAGAMLMSSTKTATELRAQVTSPGGTTAAGVTVLENAATRAAFINAVAAATNRSIELGSA